jgi:hypothetical protein
MTPPATTESQPTSSSGGGLAEIRRKLVIVGDYVGKTPLLM